MYNLEKTRKLIKSKGVQYTLDLIFECRLPEDVREELEEANGIRNGIPCISLILALAY